MSAFSASEQAVIDEMVSLRSPRVARPPWMQSHRYLRCQKDAQRRIAALPPRRQGASPEGQTYQAARRVRIEGGVWHESDGDLPICALAGHFINHPELKREHAGSGPVNCGHCRAANS